MARIPHSLVRALHTVPLFAGLDETMLLRIVGESANLLWPAGSTVFSVGDDAEALYVVVSGRVAILDGDRELAQIEAGGHFGEQSLLHRSTHSKIARAVEDTELLVLPRDAFEDLLRDDPELATEVRNRLDERVARSRTG
jgi:PPM family protein phosphatase